MRKHTKFVVSVVTLAVAGFFLPSLRAQEKVEAGPPKVHQVTGIIEKLDEQSVTIKTDKGDRAFAIDVKTRFGTKLEPKKLSDFKKGDKVLVFFAKEEKGGFVVKAITSHKE